MQKLIDTFVELAQIDEVYPNEKQIMEYISKRLDAANISHTTDSIGNIIASIPGQSDDALALCAHVDIAAPLYGRQIVMRDNEIATDGVALLGGDDKTAVAAMLELVDRIAADDITPKRPLELVFTVGEENGLNGSLAIGDGVLKAKDMLIFDWLGGVNNIISRSPARYALDVHFVGKDAHPGQWQLGRNAGAALMEAAAGLEQGEYADGVIFTIGTVAIGDARNKVPGTGSFQAEMRSYSPANLETAANEIEQHLRNVAENHEITPEIKWEKDPNALVLNADSQLFKQVAETLAAMGLQPNIEETYGRFDGNSFAAIGMNAIVMGAAYYNPHTPAETVNIAEFVQMYDFIERMCLAK